MSVTKITTKEFDQMVQAAAVVLKNNAEFINSLNVFPVPDGDTGTNMNLSFASGAKYVAASSTTKIGEQAQALAKGLLMGARGNSGVILSQIFRGFSKDVADKTTLSTVDFAEAITAGAKTAYQSVMKPTEGTILTVIRYAANAGQRTAEKTDNLSEVADEIAKAADLALQKTPDLLPVLKQVGVVDSGGQGLVFVLQAFADVLNQRQPSNDVRAKFNVESNKMDQLVNQDHHESAQGQLNPADIVYGYCTQMTVRFGKGKAADKKFDYDIFYNYLAPLGDSLLVINDDEVAKVHVHTEQPGKVLAWGQQFGDLVNIKIDNMRDQQATIMETDATDQPKQQPEKSEQPRDLAIIAIVTGQGMEKLFRSVGVTSIISGGQTMNPSTEDIVKAVNQSHAKQALVLPNNKNIFLAAEQAEKLTDIPMKVVHTKTIPQGLTAMFSLNPEASLVTNQKNMDSSLEMVKSGQLTAAVRDTQINGFDIKKGQYMGIIDGEIQVISDELDVAATKTVKKMLDADSENVTIIYGQGASEQDAKQIEEFALKQDSELEVEIHQGDQPVYPLIVAVE
ncbi:Dihydroxyacetone kinase family protein [Fructilactobacillus florum 8D]|uniref:Dihydroxyacetone kinase family protein n=1 Tax=Fructilactobacillus florum 8D TaxID=1221538 RepID=W9EFZ9_9LACO|nr:DAK2 domain-containing protein [Fructilactobacillus florum]ETO40201.1 Dihydroxyacetone kinase family protein [Fructilactobacillus florum 8D]